MYFGPAENMLVGLAGSGVAVAVAVACGDEG